MAARRIKEEPETRSARRAPREVRELILAAAHELFTTHGYQGTKTRQIAEKAGVSESVVFRNFASKAELFEETALKPLADVIDEWAALWDRVPPASASAEEVVRSFVAGFYGAVAEHRELLRTLFAARTQGGDSALSDVADRLGDQLGRGLRIMGRVLLEQGAAREYKGLDVPVTVAVAAGSILSLLVLDDWLFPAQGERPSQARQIEELVQMLQHGVQHRSERTRQAR